LGLTTTVDGISGGMAGREQRTGELGATTLQEKKCQQKKAEGKRFTNLAIDIMISCKIDHHL